MSKASYEEHVRKLLRDAHLIEYYNEVAEITSIDTDSEHNWKTVLARNTISGISSGRYAYFFNIGDIVNAKDVRRILIGKYDNYLKANVQFIPIYLPTQDRIVTLKYWGKYKNFFKSNTDFIIEFNSQLSCYPSSICEYENIKSDLNDPEVRRALGLYWTFSISLPYNERNPLLGNTFIIPGNNDLHVLKIYHTYARNTADGIEYLDINFNRNIIKNRKINNNYMTFFFVKDLEVDESTRKEYIEFIPYLSDKHFNDADLYLRLAFLVLRSMYIKKPIDETDYLNIGNMAEFKLLFLKLHEIIERDIYYWNIKIKFNIDNLIQNLIQDESLEFKNKNEGRSINMFVIDDKNDIIFVHPLIALSFLTADSSKAELYSSIVDIFKNSTIRKNFMKILSERFYPYDLKEKLHNLLNKSLNYTDISLIKKMFKYIYSSVLLNKVSQRKILKMT